ncbi:MAG TPA: GNAT family protein [Candidatus Dormibacteraeota bacterium]|nr:GNAT family protein [Candidatus Dormibacteraeota bacterium]
MQDLRPVYLLGSRVYLRAMVEADKERGAAWLDETFPVNAARAEAALKEEHRGWGWRRSSRRLAIALAEDEEVVGSARVSSHNGYRTCRLTFVMAPWRDDADALRAEALELLVRWLRDENELMVVTADLPADERATIAAAEALGMVRNARLREWFGRPGGRVDCLVYQALNPRWEVRDA